MLFAVGDLTDVRFCTSPLWETVFSVRAFGAPGRFPALSPWIRAVRVALADRDDVAEQLAYLAAFVRSGSWVPDFLTPPPTGRCGEFDAEHRQVLATPLELVTADILACANWRPITRVARAAATDPQAALTRFGVAIKAWHDLAIAPHWSRMQALHDADIAYRTRQLSLGGLRLLFDTLHPSVHWAGDRLIGDDPWNIRVTVAGRGLPLQPTVFGDRRVLWTVRNESQPMAVYPARAVGTLWSAAQPVGIGGAGLSRVLGPARAEVFTLLRGPATTTDLARRTGLSLGAVSQHLAALHGAGLAQRARHGREVFYEATQVGVALLRVNGLA
ncbi:ArsR family transcriptional regulator [Micromonospora sp. NPDC005806]|uniref:ArsR/SmtB family transcription factor n=1 Tax=Micromonospora sp. NPDC005806 TaxID=3364234 RepID=UPI0036B0941F